MKKQLMIVATLMMVGLASCSSLKRGNNASVTDANSVGAQTAGVGENGEFGSGATDEISKKVYLFQFDRSDIQESDRGAVTYHANYLVAHPTAKILLEGHTDPRGSREYNVALGERRAKSVLESMKAQGVNPDQIRVISYGAERLAAMGRTEEDFQQDRRVVLVYLQQ